MVCRNCGLENPSTFTYCGSCGEPVGPIDEEASPHLDDTAITPAVPARPAQRSRAQAVPMVPSKPEGVAAVPPKQGIVCRNCGRANAANRSVCYQCGRRLVLPAELRLQRSRPGQPGRDGGFLAGGASVMMVLLAVLAGGLLLAVMLLGGGAPPTEAPVAWDSPGATTLPTVGPTAVPVVPPPGQPTPLPTEQAAGAPATPTVSPPPQTPAVFATTTPPPAGTLGCSGSSAETAWHNLTRDDARRRVPEGSAWCVHQAYVVPYFGSGRIRLVADGETVLEINHEAASDQAEYSVPFMAPLFIEEGAQLVYQYRCETADCAAAIQVGYDELPTP